MRALLALAALTALLHAGCDDRPATRLPGTWYAFEARGMDVRGCEGEDALVRDGALVLTFVEPLCGDWCQTQPGDRVTLRPRWVAWEKSSGRIIGRTQ